MTLLTSGCASVFDEMSLAAQAKFQQMFANTFAQKLKYGIDLVVEQLALKGGFLDDPLVRILLPPPLGLVIGVARDLSAHPQAALLETLINRAAEDAIPVAGPILKNIVAKMDADTLQKRCTRHAVQPDQLAQYVAKQAAEGLFKKVAAWELLIRDELDSVMSASGD
jgi:hypothetical protein